jgi:hypothetical protein
MRNLDHIGSDHEASSYSNEKEQGREKNDYRSTVACREAQQGPGNYADQKAEDSQTTTSVTVR